LIASVTWLDWLAVSFAPPNMEELMTVPTAESTRGKARSAACIFRTVFSWARRALRLVFLIVLLGPAVVRASDSLWTPSAAEIVGLPLFCWGGFNPQFKDPKYNLYGTFPTCGGGLNHYCLGLVALNRAKRAVADRQARLGWLHAADGEFKYTANALRGSPPSCGLHEHLQQTLIEFHRVRLQAY